MSIYILFLPLVSDDRKLDASRDIQHTNQKKCEELVKLIESKKKKKRKRSQSSPYDSFYTVQYYGNVTKTMGKHIDIICDLRRRKIMQDFDLTI